MKNYIKLLICLFAFVNLFFLNVISGPLYKPASGPFVEIIKSGKPGSQIIIPSSPSYLEEFAASELQKYFKKISQAEIPVLREGAKTTFPFSIFIGNTITASNAGIKLSDELMGPDGFEIKSVKKGIIIQGINDLGSLFGVYELLERYFDVRWFTPGEDGLYYPKNSSLKLGQISLVCKPSFKVRWIHQGEWALNQRMNAYVKAGDKTVGINWKWGYHTYGKIIPPEKYFAEHPEYFSLVKGKRTMTLDPKDQGNQLCTTNPDVIREVAKNLIDTLRADPTINIINFCPDDNQRFCECDKCTALDEPGRDFYGKHANRFAIFNNEVARIVKKEFPKVLIKIGAYEMYMRPPLDPNYRPESNLVFQACHLWFCHNHPLGSDLCKEGETYKPAARFTPNQEFEKILDQWLKITPHVYIYEYYSIGGMNRAPLPWPLIHTMRTDIPFYRNKGIESFYTQTSNDWPRLGLNFYVAAKLCWNADLNVEDILNDYFEKFYGPAAVPMKDYFMTMEKSMVEWNGCASYGLYGVSGLKVIGPKIFTPVTMDKMEKLLVQAELVSYSDKNVSARVNAVRKVYDETKTVLKDIK